MPERQSLLHRHPDYRVDLEPSAQKVAFHPDRAQWVREQLVARGAALHPWIARARRLALAPPLLLLACAVEPSASVAPAELAQRIRAGDAPLVLDVRTPKEYARGHIPGAINIPHSELAERLSELPVSRSDEIIVHCQSGRRASTAEQVLVEAGFTNVRDLEGHMQAWRAGAHPTE